MSILIKNKLDTTVWYGPVINGAIAESSIRKLKTGDVDVYDPSKNDNSREIGFQLSGDEQNVAFGVKFLEAPYATFRVEDDTQYNIGVTPEGT